MNEKYFQITIAVTLLLTSCNSSEWSFRYASQPRTENIRYELYDLYQDDQGEKGVVVYRSVDSATGEGSVFVLSLNEGLAAWGPQDKVVYPFSDPDLNALALMPGYALDINQMVDYLGRMSYPAFAWCLNKNPEGEAIHGGSWILPGIGEWIMLLDSVDLEKLNDALVSYGGVVLEGGHEYYWSASEDQEGVITLGDNDPDYEPNYDFNPRERAVSISSEKKIRVNKVYWNKSLPNRVRAIKYIYSYEPYSGGK